MGDRSTEVLLVACAFPPVGRGNSITNGCIARELAKGFEVTVLAIKEARGVLLSYDTDDSLRCDGVQGLRVRRFAAPNWLGLNEVLYGVGLLPCYYLNWALRVWRRRHTIGGRPAAVIGIYPVFSNLVVAHGLSRALGVPLIVDFRDDLAGVMTRGWRRIYRRFYRRFEGRLVRAAARVTVTTEELAEDLARRHGVERTRFEVLYNIVPQSPGGSAVRSDGGGQEFRVVYAGAMSAVQRPEILLQAHRRLLARRPELVGRLVVDICGPRNRYFRRHVEPHGHAGVRFHGFQPRARVDELMAGADVGFLSLSGNTYAYATPTKLFDYIEYRLPILGSLPAGAARRLVEAHGLGVVGDDGDVDGLAAGLERLYDDAPLRQRCQQGLGRARELFTVQTQGANWRRVVGDVIDAADARDHDTALHQPVTNPQGAARARN